ncbi:hypothetical protein Sjap_022131 [Stephania japonica]|uniref:Uncharacterized protein n=1 Tax=Stephania japonica TaxID=461633 RepID=A0AAP0ENQ8_9MAGN
MELKYKLQSSFAELKLLEKVLQSTCLLRFSLMLVRSCWIVETLSTLQKLNQLGKTLAFGIPTLVHVLCKKKLGDSGRACPWCSVLSPTRELAQQLYAMMLLARYLDLCGGHRAISHGIGLKVQPKQDDLLQSDNGECSWRHDILCSKVKEDSVDQEAAEVLEEEWLQLMAKLWHLEFLLLCMFYARKSWGIEGEHVLSVLYSHLQESLLNNFMFKFHVLLHVVEIMWVFIYMFEDRIPIAHLRIA